MTTGNKFQRWLEEGRNVKWYEYWDPRSGPIGGLIMSAVLIFILSLFL